MKKRKLSRTPLSAKTGHPQGLVSDSVLSRMEFHRTAMALLPKPADRKPGVAYMVSATQGGREQRFCSCSGARKKTCAHILELAQIYKAQRPQIDTLLSEAPFRSSIWFRLASILAEGCPERPQSVRLHFAEHRQKRILKVCGANGAEILTYLFQGRDHYRFIERCGNPPDDHQLPHRGRILGKLARLTRTETEQILQAQGLKSRGQTLQESFWYRLAYHGFREFGHDGGTFQPSVDETSGNFMVTFKSEQKAVLFHMVIARNRVQRLLASFKELLPNQHNMPIYPIPLKSIFKITRNTKLDLDVRPVIQLIQKNGESKFYEREDLERFRYGNLIYVKELGILAELEQPGKKREFGAPRRMIIKKYQIPRFLNEHAHHFQDGRFLLDEADQGLKILKTVERVEIAPEAIYRDWCWLSVIYGFSSSDISLAEILAAKKEGQRFIGTPDGWVDCQSPDLDSLDALLHLSDEKGPDGHSNAMKFSRMDLFRIRAATNHPANITGAQESVSEIKNLFAMKAPNPLPEIKGMTSALRNYQQRGTEWLWFLAENGFGGLLCDDMGLGKTHQTLALMLCLREQNSRAKPFLVVCPTTVLSHWLDKIRVHAPGLKATIYHGGQRDLEEATNGNQAVLTSYGILRQDIALLENKDFALAVFDEIQNLKNPDTLSYAAAQQIRAGMKLGLTGTPIENSLSELKALMDLTVPGYLGSNAAFQKRYIELIESNVTHPRRHELTRLIAPFTLRRLKKTVLSELPEKIEDIRTCRLSDDQLKLYRDAVSARGRELLDLLAHDQDPVPYMHIFALLTRLKQICNHPASVEGSLDNCMKYRSGKWELFTELLSEALDSGQKVVVYSQFLDMIGIIAHHLERQQVGFVTLTGGSRKRGRILTRFDQDPDCRVFVGSLKAGGVGIDLVAASVVIHYDRWWNAAKEDQATDRVHRIGQKRGVQVFKLVTEGTLEEKISAIIERKRHLMDSVIKEDDPGLLKAFSREDLIQMLSTSALEPQARE